MAETIGTTAVLLFAGILHGTNYDNLCQLVVTLLVVVV